MGSIDIPLKDKIILITGGASGIGFALTKQSSDLGAKVLVGDIRTTPDFDRFAAGKENILYVQSDVTHWPDFLKLFDACERTWNDVPDGYGICAGLFEPTFSNFWQDPEQEKGYKLVDVNVSHPIKLTRLAIKKSLGRGKRASVCIIASIAGLRGSLSAPLYCATKHAIVGFVKSMKDSEPLTSVKITTICPGLVNTPLFTPEQIAQYSFAKFKALTPDDVAKNMLKLIQEKEYGCGTVLELSMAGTRVVPEWNIDPPRAEGTGQNEKEEAAVLQALLGPIQEKLGAEKASKL